MSIDSSPVNRCAWQTEEGQQCSNMRIPYSLNCADHQPGVRLAAIFKQASGKDCGDLRDRITHDASFQTACQRYAHGNGSSAAIAAAALKALDAAI